MTLPLTVSWLVLPFWYWLTWVVLEEGPINVWMLSVYITDNTLSSNCCCLVLITGTTMRSGHSTPGVCLLAAAPSTWLFEAAQWTALDLVCPAVIPVSACCWKQDFLYSAVDALIGQYFVLFRSCSAICWWLNIFNEFSDCTKILQKTFHIVSFASFKRHNKRHEWMLTINNESGGLQETSLFGS